MHTRVLDYMEVIGFHRYGCVANISDVGYSLSPIFSLRVWKSQLGKRLQALTMNTSGGLSWINVDPDWIYLLNDKEIKDFVGVK